MRRAIVTAGLAVGLILGAGMAAGPALSGEPEQADPFVGRTRAEVIDLLGEPDKVRGKSGHETLVCKLVRLADDGQTVPPAVGDTLAVGLVSGTDAMLSWNGVGAGDYNDWWDDRADFGNARHAGATGGATSYTDTDVLAAGEVRYYKVRSVNNCRWESP